MNPQKHLSSRPSLKSKFTKRFLRALLKINKERSKSVSFGPREHFRQYHRVRTAADKSLACAVGSRRAWSRAMLYKIRIQGRRRRGLTRRINGEVMKKRSGILKQKMGREEVDFGQAKKLRKLVPGGEGMDLSCLLEEAVHYIKCLSTQVQVMRSIADLYTT